MLTKRKIELGLLIALLLSCGGSSAKDRCQFWLAKTMSGAYHPLISLGGTGEIPINTCLFAVCREKSATTMQLAYNAKETMEFMGGQLFSFSKLPKHFKDGEQVQQEQQRIKYQSGQFTTVRLTVE